MTIGGARPRPAGLALQDPPLPQTRGAGRTIWEDRNMKKRLISWLLILALCVSVLPAAALAAEPEDTALTGAEQTIDPAETEPESDPAEAKQALTPAEPLRAVSANSGTETHKHYRCGGATCNEKGHDSEDSKWGSGEITFKKWTYDSKTGWPTKGDFYLTDNVTLSDTLTVSSGNLTLCLNGYSITMDKVSNKDVIKVENGGFFTLCDCKQGGTIGHTQPSQFNGRGVTVEGSGSSFTMYGGKIANNMVGGAAGDERIRYGGGVLVCNKGSFSMVGGEITGNTARYGGGVAVGLANGLHGNTNEDIGGTFNMTGGRIYENTCTYNGGGGVYAVASDALNFCVSAAPQITDNVYKKDISGTTNVANNVYLEKPDTGDPAKIIVSQLTSAASIGVTVPTPDKGMFESQVVATFYGDVFAKHFFSDAADRRLQLDGNQLIMVASVHENHPICGASCTHNGKHENKTWTAAAEPSEMWSANTNYYLTQDIKLDKTWSPKHNVTLCLNGYSIIADGDFDAIEVSAGYTFTLCDCNGGGEITHAEGKTGAGVYMKGAEGNNKTAIFDMYGGTISGNTGHKETVGGAETTRGGGVYVDNDARFHMYGGTITGNTAAQGGGVYYVASNRLYVSGKVDITGNKGTDGEANNVYVLPARGATPPTVPFYIGPDNLDASARIGVRVDDNVIATGAHSPVAQFVSSQNAESAYHEGNFISDNGEPYGFKMEAREHDTLTSTHVVNLYNGLPHIHYLCNGKDDDGENKCTKGGGHSERKTVEFKPWTGTTSLPEEAGNYYLTKDVVLEKTWDVPVVERFGCVNLCLNGHSITLSESSSDKNTIRVGKVGTYTGLAISDCNGSGQGNGKITGASEAGVYVSSTANTTWFYLYGGKITGNGTGVYNLRDSVMYGGTITGNNVGVDYGTSKIATFRVSGDVQITGNQSTDGIANNVHLNNSQTLIVSGALSDTAKIGVTTASTIAEGRYATVAKGDDHNVNYTLTTDDLNHFESDAGYTPMLNGNTVIFANGKLHQHAACGKTGCTDGHSDVIWTPLTYDAENKLCYGGKAAKQEGSENLITYVLPAGNYYLSDNITIDGFIQIKSNVNLCLNGKTLSTTKENWSAQYFTFIVVSKGGTLTLCDCESGGTIRANNLDGGVQTNVGDTTTSGGKFIMYGGTITGVNYGVRAADEFVMYGGAIKTVEGGVYTTSSGSFRMYGGEISDNRSYGARYNGSTVTVGGSAKITGNGYTENVTLGNGTITIDSSLTQEARIGVHLLDSDLPTEGSKKLFATGANNTKLDYAAIFSCDNGSDYVLTKDDSGNLYFGKHQHVWSYTAEGATITATCTANGCNLTGNSGGSVTIVAPVAPDGKPLTYDGYAKEATLEGALTTGVTLTANDIKYYYKIGEQENQLETGAKPTNAKSYRAEITVGGQTASVDYEIKKATPQASDFLFSGPNDLTYDGNAKFATVSSNKIGGITITRKHYKDGVKIDGWPIDVGTYTVKIDVTESTNYTAATDLTDELNWKFTIQKGTYGGTPSPKTVEIVKGRSAAQTGTLTAADFFPEGQMPADAAIVGVTPTSGTIIDSIAVDGTKHELNYVSNTNITATENESYTVTISTKNYSDFTVTLTFHPADKQPQTNFAFKDVVDGKVAKVYGDPDFKFEATGQVNGSNVTGYDSSNENVATVANDGTVTIKGAGAAVIKATASATDDYAEGKAEYTLTVSKKTLTEADLEFTQSSTFTKVYDGTASTTATVQIKATAKVNTTDTLPEVKGTYAYNSKDVNSASKVTFTSTESSSTNYTLPANLTVDHAASITPADQATLTVTSTTATYGTDLTLTVSGGSGDGAVTYTVADDTGKATIIDGSTLRPVQAGTVKVTATKASDGNYNSISSAETVITIGRATYTGTVETKVVNIVKNFSVAQTGTLTAADFFPAGQVPADAAIVGVTPTTGDRIIDSIAVEGTAAHTLRYVSEARIAAAADESYTVTIATTNYADITATLTFHLTNKQTQNLSFTNPTVTATYKDPAFTQTVNSAHTAVTYSSSNTDVATVNAKTGEVTIVGAGTANITATAAETDVYASASVSYTLKVNKLRIHVPTAGLNNKLEYNGKEQTYTPDELDTTYCSIIGNTAKDVPANNAHYTATVSLNDTANTEWNEGVDNTTPRECQFWILPARAIVTALDKKITAGQPAPDLTNAKLGEDYTITGLYGSDSLGIIKLYYADPADTATEVTTPDTSKAGTYAIVAKLDGEGNSNYTMMSAPGTLTIETVQTSQKLGISAPGRTPGGSYELTPKNAQPGDTVTITVSPDKGCELGDLTVRDMDGNELDLKRDRSGDYTFTMPKSSVSVSISFVRADDALFDDVLAGDYYYAAVQWAAEQGITGGVGGNLFAPNAACTRAQIVTFLWRAAGSPEPETMSAFKDVPAGAYYAKAVAWAVENGITNGTGDGKFSPDAPCTRAQAVTFLARALDESADGAADFTDVSADAYYAKPVAWAVEANVTNGVSKTKFAPNENCTRAQIVTFLYRAYRRAK